MTDTPYAIRPATPADIPAILTLIRELADYERLADQVVATEARLRAHLFGRRPYAEALVATAAGEAATTAPAETAAIAATEASATAPIETSVIATEETFAFALFFHNYSTFLARPGLYLEDLYVRPAWRGRGVGQAMLARLAAIAVERDCGRFEWSVLDWNEPAIGFYRRLGAEAMSDWTTMRLTGQALHGLADLA